MMNKYIWNILVALDILANALLAGAARQTLSARLGLAQDDCKVCRWICRFLDWFDPGHCDRQAAEELGMTASWKPD